MNGLNIPVINISSLINNISSLSLHCFNAVKCAKCGSSNFTAEISVKSAHHDCSRMAMCTCLICLYTRPAVCIVTAELKTVVTRPTA